MLHPRVMEAVRNLDIAHQELDCDPDLADTAAFCQAYHFLPQQAANTILVVGKGTEPTYAACIVLATTKLDVNKKVCQLLGVKKASFASAEQTVTLSNMMIGGVTPVGLHMPIFIDAQVMEQSQIVIGGGNRSSKLLLSPQELRKLPLVHIADGLAIPR